jgi:O-antigen/teichoic acid export membrane protein
LKEKSLINQIKYGALISYVSIGVSVLLTIAYTPWMIRTIGQENYGLYTLGTSLMGVITVDFGLGAAVTRFVSKYRAEGDTDSEKSFLEVIFGIYLILDLIVTVVFAVVFFFLKYIYVGLSEQELAVFKWIYLIFSLYSVLSFPMTPLNGIIQAHERFIFLKLCDLTQRIVTVVMVVICLSGNLGVIAIAFANAFVGLTVIILKMFYVKRWIPLRLAFVKTKKYAIDKIKDIISFSGWTMISNYANNIFYNSVPSILAITLDSKSIAVYSPAGIIGGYIYLIQGAIDGMFLPTISRYIAGESEKKINDLMVLVGRYQFFILGFIYVVFFSYGDIFIELWLGKGFEESYYCCLIYLIPLVLMYTQRIGNDTITARGYVKERAFVQAAASVIGITFTFIGSKMFGMIAACIGVALGGILYALGMNLILGKMMGIKIGYFYRNCYGNMLLPIVVSGALGVLSKKVIHQTSLITCVIAALVIAVLYVGLVWFFSLKKGEKSMYLSLLGLKHSQ